MLSDAKPPKRPRLSENNYGFVLPIVGEFLERDRDLWMEDGSVVLVAEETAFKVYKGLLSAHSPVFADMFSSATADETYDGCPTVHVSDSPTDLKWLLTHLIPKRLPDMDRDHWFTYQEVSALTRLAHKYQIDTVERYAVGLLKDEFMTDFEKWESEVAESFGESTLACYNPIDAIYLARLTDTPSILPLAFYLCTQEPDMLIDGKKREDGTLMVLDKADAKRCIEGYGELWRLSEQMLQRIFLTPASKSCKTLAACKPALKRMLKGLSDAKSASPNHLADWGRDIERAFGCCDACLDTVRERERAERCELWKKLPKIFRLQDEVKGHWPGY